MTARWVNSGVMLKAGLVFALAGCAGQADCASVSCAAGGVTLDFELYVAATPAARSATVTLCVMGVKPSVCSEPRRLSLGRRGLLTVPLNMPDSARLSIEVTANAERFLQETTSKVKLRSGPCCPVRAVLTLDERGHAKLDNRLTVDS